MSHIIRLGLDKLSRLPVNDQSTNRMAWFPRGTDFSVQVARMSGTSVIATTDTYSLTLEIRQVSDKDGTALYTNTMSAAELTECTTEQWNAGTGQHCTFVLPKASTAFDLGTGKDEKQFWLIVKQLDSDSKLTVWGTAFVLGVEMGIGAAASPPTPAASYLTAAETTALVNSAVANIVGGVTPFNAIRIYNPTTASFVLAQPKYRGNNTVFTFTDEIPS